MPNTPVGSVILCPNCSAPMKQRTAKQGHFAGKAFYGCSKYPTCKGVRNIDDSSAVPRADSNRTVNHVTSSSPSFKDFVAERKKSGW